MFLTRHRFTVCMASVVAGGFFNQVRAAETISDTFNRVDVPHKLDLSRYARTANGIHAAESIQTISPALDFDPIFGPPGSGFPVNGDKSNVLYNAVMTISQGAAGISAAIESLAAGSNANLSSATLAASSSVMTSMRTAMQQMGSDSGLRVGLDSSQPPVLAATDVANTVRNLNDPSAPGRVWLQGIGSYGKLDGEQGNSSFEQRTAGTVLGVDWSLSPEWRMGVLGGYSKTDLDSHNFEGTLHSWHVGAYAMRQDGPLALRLGAAYSGHDGDNKRTVEFEGFSDRPKGNYDADSQQAFAELGYLLGSGRLNVEPFANLGYQRYHREGFTEKGGLAALAVDSQTQDNFSSTFGVRLAQLNQLQNGISVTPRGSLGWRHTYGDVESETRQAFVLGGSGFNVQGSALDRDSLIVGAGVDVGISARQTLSIGYNAEVGSNSRNQALTGQWQMSF